jgi:hypothetical protein
MKTVNTMQRVGSYAGMDDFLAGVISVVLTLELISTDMFMLPIVSQ